MKTKTITAMMLIFLVAPSSHALEVFLTGPTEVGLGAQFEIGFWLDATGDPILGGGVDISYDPLLVGFSNFDFNPLLLCVGPCGGPNLLDSDFSFAPADDGFGLLSFLTFGNFDGIDTGPLLIGTLTFDALALGLADFGLDPSDLAGWTSGVSPFPAIDLASIDAFGWSVNIVPEPQVLLLLGGGVLIMAGVRRRRQG